MSAVLGGAGGQHATPNWECHPCARGELRCEKVSPAGAATAQLIVCRTARRLSRTGRAAGRPGGRAAGRPGGRAATCKAAIIY